MATVSPVISNPYNSNDLFLVTWSGIANGDTCGPITDPSYGVYADKSVQISGTFGASAATIDLQGSIDGTNYYTLHDPFSNLITSSSADLWAITEAVPYIKPIISGGDGTTDITVSLFLKKVS